MATPSHRLTNLSNSTIQSNRDIQLTIDLASRAQLNYKRNKQAKELYHALYPIPLPQVPAGRSREYDDMIKRSFPGFFPKNVQKFVQMTGDGVKYLLVFYGLDDLDDAVLAPPDTPLDINSLNIDSPATDPPATDLELPYLLAEGQDAATRAGRYRCLEILANHIGFNLDSIFFPAEPKHVPAKNSEELNSKK
ncbi:hypothetical protein TWF506_004316 [Arthrobotrys conoides]|uniref:Uncharacterized protein n=1 Tax=Arthrobotrys conoides TaxID=74498 RepID=A0AAN8NJU0_9PEZI